MTELNLDAVNITKQFTVMTGVFVVSFFFSTAVSIAKIYVKFNTQRLYRVIQALQLLNVATLIDLLVITYFRYNHTGEVCFCHYEEITPESNCMTLSKNFI